MKKKEFTAHLHVRVTKKMKADLDRESKTRKITIAELVRCAIWYLDYGLGPGAKK